MSGNYTPVKYILVYSDRHESYDLFRDLKDRTDTQLVVTKKKPVHSGIIKKIRRLHTSGTIANHFRLPFKQIWYKKPDISIDDNVQYYIIIIDMALSELSLSYLKKITKKPNVKTILLMINSVKSNTIRQINTEMHNISWDSILTFDDKDAEEYGYKKVGYCYYSKHDEKSLESQYQKENTDAYFIGTIKSTRKKLILGVYEALRNSGLKIEFHLLQTIKDSLEVMPYQDEIDYFTAKDGLIPYDEILASVNKTKTIIEIVQEGQSGPSLRYYEAICYNKKLLTNNPNISTFPLYDSRYMRVFKEPAEIDLTWLSEECEVDYHYNNEFSPIHLIDRITDYC